MSKRAMKKIEIAQGVTSWQVLQANTRDEGTLQCSGPNPQGLEGEIEGRVLDISAKAPKTIHPWGGTGKVNANGFRLRVSKIPVGGPYKLEVRIGLGKKTVAECQVQPFFVGDLFLLAGQSNMQGVGNSPGALPPDPLVATFAMNDEWRQAEDPLHLTTESCDYVHNPEIEDDESRQGLYVDVTGWTKGTGLGMSFAREIVKHTGRPVGLIPCALGGTSMDQWNPNLGDQGGRSLYGAMMRRLEATGGKVRAVLWYQGESDAFDEVISHEFRQKFTRFVTALRRESGMRRLPFFYVQIGRHVTFMPPAPWNRVQDTQRDVERELRPGGMTASVDLELDDQIHIGTQGLHRLGRRLAHLVRLRLYGNKQLQPGPRISKVTSEKTEFGWRLRVRFTGLNGDLRTAGKLAGFSMREAKGLPLPDFYKQEIDPENPTEVLLWLTFYEPDMHPRLPDGAELWYGYGVDPYCNLTDSGDMPLPVTGPISVSVR